ncbi:hypothetical protein CC2G_005870 [Coprinopsis cinerea AmutBmut pab1-1]|nr:hypothetical protein CC2G_005870 [Coprinopsis cinerea AmutBmut pab1-1]
MSEGRDSKLRTHQESLESESQEALLPVTTTTSSISTAGASEQADMRVTEKGERNLDGIAGIAALCAVGILAAITWFIVLTNNPTSLGWFALHPLLQTLSLVLFTIS